MAWAGTKKKLLGDYIQIIINIEDKKKAKKILKQAYKESLRLQKIFNFYDNYSELSKLNNKRKHQASKELLEVIKYALKLCEETKGAYDISLGKNFLQRKENKKIKKLECSYKDITLTKETIKLNHKDVLIDLGSIAKGYIADKLGDYLKSQEIKDFVIDVRGDILLCGIATPLIRIQHPRKEEEYISTLSTKNAGIATSGDYEQFDKHFENSHLINTKSSCSVTVIAPTLMQADTFATVLSVLEEKEIEKILKKNTKIAVMTINKKMKKQYYNNFRILASNI